ncbi:MAG: hypothetical protein HKM04_08635, partial [Legionellales bacterium]|nr:hypothetical protein [Legionellales bacterium]
PEASLKKLEALLLKKLELLVSKSKEKVLVEYFIDVFVLNASFIRSMLSNKGYRLLDTFIRRFQVQKQTVYGIQKKYPKFAKILIEKYRQILYPQIHSDNSDKISQLVEKTIHFYLEEGAAKKSLKGNKMVEHFMELSKQNVFPIFIDQLLKENKEVMKVLAINQVNFISDLLHAKLVLTSNKEQKNVALLASSFLLEKTIFVSRTMKSNDPRINSVKTLEEKIRTKFDPKIKMLRETLSKQEKEFSMTTLQSDFIKKEIEVALQRLDDWHKIITDILSNSKEDVLVADKFKQAERILHDINEQIKSILPRYRLFQFNKILALLTPDEQRTVFENCKRKARDDKTAKTPLFGEVPAECFLMVEKILELSPELIGVPDRYNKRPIVDGLISTRAHSKKDNFPYFDLLVANNAPLAQQFISQNRLVAGTKLNVTLFSGSRTERPNDEPTWPMGKYPPIKEEARKHAIQAFLSRKESAPEKEGWLFTIEEGERFEQIDKFQKKSFPFWQNFTDPGSEKNWRKWKNTWIDMFSTVMPKADNQANTAIEDHDEDVHMEEHNGPAI